MNSTDNNTINEEAFNAGIKHFEDKKDILDIPASINEADVDSFKDGYYFALDKSQEDGNRDDLIGGANYPDLEEDSFESIYVDDIEDQEPVGKEIFDQIFDDIEAIQKEQEQEVIY